MFTIIKDLWRSKSRKEVDMETKTKISKKLLKKIIIAVAMIASAIFGAKNPEIGNVINNVADVFVNE